MAICLRNFAVWFVVAICVFAELPRDVAGARFGVGRERRSDDTPALQAAFDNLAQEFNNLKAQLAALQTKLSAQDAKLDKFGQVVAFHAWNIASNGTITAPHGTLVLNHAETNVGKAYDPQTGFFTAPVAGTYFLHASFKDRGASDDNDYVNAGIYVNNKYVAYAISDQRHGYSDHASLSTVVHIAAGKKAQLRSNSGTVEYFNTGTYTTFSGFLIKAD